METGLYSGKGKNKTWSPSCSFIPSDSVVILATVRDNNGVSLPNAVDILIGGPETVPLTSGSSDAEGIAEATWQTQTLNKKGQGGTAPGNYKVSNTDVTVSKYPWERLTASTTFSI